MLNRSSCCSEILSSIFSGWYPEQHASSESSQGPSTSSGINIHAPEVCNSLYELYRPEGTPSMQVLFFHGLQLGKCNDAHLLTWESEDGNCIWPQTWLVEKFPEAHVLCVWYNGHVIKRSHQSSEDMFIIGENLISDLVQANIGQEPNCPVILVGHSFGGLVIKEVCHQAFVNLKGINKAKLQTFLDSVKGIFYYATPHHGSRVVAHLTGSPLLEYFKLLSSHTARLNMQFNQLSINQKWRIQGLGETLPTQWGTFKKALIVEEASARVENFYTVKDVDHFSICKPKSRTSGSFSQLIAFLSDIAADMKENSSPDNLQFLPDFIVGIDFPVQDIIGKLASTTRIGLVGMGGLGKTTLAKKVFNILIQQFEYSCFLPNVKDIKGEVGAVKNEAWTNMYCRGKKVTGDSWIDGQLRGKKLLLVLDDISDDRDEAVLSEIATLVNLESRFIVTSRDKHLVDNCQGDIFEVPFLNEVSALKLFKSCAFPTLPTSESIPESIIESVVKKCDGLPLTLKVIGKYLKGKDDDYWKAALDALDKAEDVKDLKTKIWAKLRISFEALEPKEQQIFLDATTFFSSNKNWSLGEAQAAWRVAYEAPGARLLWQTLVDRSLVYEAKQDDNIKVHEQLQSLGRKIASELNYNAKCRVWDGQVGSQILQSTHKSNGKEFYALRVASLKPHGEIADISIASTARLTLKKLQFLEFQDRVITDGAKEDGSFPTELVLFKCVGQTLFDPALQNCLAVLKISYLEYLPDSIAQLSSLSYLKITDSENLRFLPESFGKLSSLKDLEISGRTSIRALPDSFGELKSLQRLAFSYLYIPSLPESFGELSSLNHLTFQFCPQLHTLPESFRRLSSLNHLAFTGCNALKTLPESFGQLASLKFLQFRRFGITTLPKSFGKLKALDHLEFDMCGEANLIPDSFGQLTALRYLKLSCCGLESLPESFGQLKALDHLEIYVCNNLDKLPKSFGQLKSLRYLQLHRCPIKSLPESFWQLSGLNHLNLDNPELDTLSESFGQFTGLQSLTISVYTQRIPNSLGDLKDLRQLKICLHSAASIPDSIKNLPSLQMLYISFYPDLDNLLPTWLVEPNASREFRAYASIEFQVQDGCFLVTRSCLQ